MSSSHPALDEFFDELSKRTGRPHVFGDYELIRSSAPGKRVVWVPPAPGTQWIEASAAPKIRIPEGDIFSAVAEELRMVVWEKDVATALIVLWKVWRDGFDKMVEERFGHGWRRAVKWGSAQRDSDFVPSNGFAIVDRVTVSYLLPRQGEIWESGETANISGVMKDTAGTSIGET